MKQKKDNSENKDTISLSEIAGAILTLTKRLDSLAIRTHNLASDFLDSIPADENGKIPANLVTEVLNNIESLSTVNPEFYTQNKDQLIKHLDEIKEYSNIILELEKIDVKIFAPNILQSFEFTPNGFFINDLKLSNNETLTVAFHSAMEPSLYILGFNSFESAHKFPASAIDYVLNKSQIRKDFLPEIISQYAIPAKISKSQDELSEIIGETRENPPRYVKYFYMQPEKTTKSQAITTELKKAFDKTLSHPYKVQGPHEYYGS